MGFVQGFPTPRAEDSPEQEEEHGEYHDDFEHGVYILSYRGLACRRGRGGRERGQHGLAYGDPLVWQLVLLHKEMIDGCQGLIHEIKIIDSLRHNVLQGHVGKIERTAIALPTIRALDHRACNREAMDAADERSMLIEATAAVLQEHTGCRSSNDAPRVI